MSTDLDVAHRGRDRGVTHQCLNRRQIDAHFQKVRREAVPQRVNAMTLLNSSPLLGFGVRALRGGLVERNILALAGEKPMFGPVGFPIRPEFFA